MQADSTWLVSARWVGGTWKVETRLAGGGAWQGSSECRGTYLDPAGRLVSDPEASCAKAGALASGCVAVVQPDGAAMKQFE
eukprot:6193443-Pleurochrysis_carterae.AAC.1